MSRVSDGTNKSEIDKPEGQQHNRESHSTLNARQAAERDGAGVRGEERQGSLSAPLEKRGQPTTRMKRSYRSVLSKEALSCKRYL